jgi:hypothetical protein
MNPVTRYIVMCLLSYSLLPPIHAHAPTWPHTPLPGYKLFWYKPRVHPYPPLIKPAFPHPERQVMFT